MLGVNKNIITKLLKYTGKRDNLNLINVIKKEGCYEMQATDGFKAVNISVLDNESMQADAEIKDFTGTKTMKARAIEQISKIFKKKVITSIPGNGLAWIHDTGINYTVAGDEIDRIYASFKDVFIKNEKVFPNLDSIFDRFKDRKASICLSPRLLEEVAKSFKVNGLSNPFIKITIIDNNSPILLEGKTDEGYIMKAVLMPIRMAEEK